MQRVQDATGVQNALAKSEWDIVLCELPYLTSAPRSRSNSSKTPVSISRSSYWRAPSRIPTWCASCTPAHATVILKAQPARMPPVVTRELAVAELTRQHRQIAQQLKEVEHKHRAVTEGSREAIGYCLDGMHIDANQAYLDVFGYENFGELEGIPVMNLIDKSDQARFKDYLRKVANQGPQPAQQFQAIRHDSSRFHVELTAAPITMHGEKCAQLLAEDISSARPSRTSFSTSTSAIRSPVFTTAGLFCRNLTSSSTSPSRGKPTADSSISTWRN